jgi:hypothetical protein
MEHSLPVQRLLKVVPSLACTGSQLQSSNCLRVCTIQRNRTKGKLQNRGPQRAARHHDAVGFTINGFDRIVYVKDLRCLKGIHFWYVPGMRDELVVLA